MPYAALYIFSYTILVIEIFVVIVKIEIHYGGMELEKITKDHINELLLILAIILGIILGREDHVLSVHSSANNKKCELYLGGQKGKWES